MDKTLFKILTGAGAGGGPGFGSGGPGGGSGSPGGAGRPWAGAHTAHGAVWGSSIELL